MFPVRDSKTSNITIGGVANMSNNMSTTGYPSIDKPWLKYYSDEAKNASLPEDTINGYLRERNKNNLDDVAINYFDRLIKYRELFAKIESATKAFSAMGITHGDIVIFATVTTPETIYAFYALNRLGAISFMLDPRTSTEGIKSCLVETSAKIVLTVDIALPKIYEATKSTSVKKVVAISPSESLPFIKKQAYKITNHGAGIHNRTQKSGGLCIGWKEFLASGTNSTFVEYSYKKDSCCVMIRTGGTTGIPKSVMLSNDNLNTMVMQYSLLGVTYNRKQKFLDIMPAFCSYGIVLGIHMPLCLGLIDVIIPQLDPDKFTDLIIKYAPAHLAGVPMHYDQLRLNKKSKNLDLSFFQMTGCGGDSMTEGFEKKISQFLRDHHCAYPITKGYGMTEISSAATTNKETLNKLGSVGIPHLKTIVSVFDKDSCEELQYGQEGEICMCAPTIMLGYYKNETETNNVLRVHKDGQVWLHSGDIGHMDEEGFVYVHGRLKRVIIRSDGHKVWPQQIENTLFSYGGVKDCAVVGRPNPDNKAGKMPIAFIVWNAQATEAQKSFANIDAFCKKFLTERDCPLGSISIDTIPRTPMGKVDYRALEQMAES